MRDLYVWLLVWHKESSCGQGRQVPKLESRDRERDVYTTFLVVPFDKTLVRGQESRADKGNDNVPDAGAFSCCLLRA